MSWATNFRNFFSRPSILQIAQDSNPHAQKLPAKINEPGDDVLISEMNEKAVAPALRNLIYAYAGNSLDCPAGALKLIFETYEREAQSCGLISRCIIDIPTNVSQDDYRNRVISVWNTLMKLVARERSVSVGSEEDRICVGDAAPNAPLALAPIVDLIRKRDLVSIFPHLNCVGTKDFQNRRKQLTFINKVYNAQKLLLTNAEQLVQRENLSANGCWFGKFFTLPKELSVCTNIKFIDVDRSDIVELPDWLDDKFTNLREISANACTLAKLPPSLLNCPALERIFMGPSEKLTNGSKEVVKALAAKGVKVYIWDSIRQQTILCQKDTIL